MTVQYQISKNKHGGPNRGQGRKLKPPGEKHKKLIISLPPELATELKNHGQKSKLIQKLLVEYFTKAP
jgi:hypothetical protein